MISPDTLSQMVDQLAARLNPEKVILFGSYARGDADENSDVDLLVVADTTLPAKDRGPAARRLLADYPVACDVIVKTPDEFNRWRSAVNHIVYFADRYGKVVYERKGHV